jgi:hypothetical protein
MKFNYSLAFILLNKVESDFKPTKRLFFGLVQPSVYFFISPNGSDFSLAFKRIVLFILLLLKR